MELLIGLIVGILAFFGLKKKSNPKIDELNKKQEHLEDSLDNLNQKQEKLEKNGVKDLKDNEVVKYWENE